MFGSFFRERKTVDRFYMVNYSTKRTEYFHSDMVAEMTECGVGSGKYQTPNITIRKVMSHEENIVDEYFSSLP